MKISQWEPCIRIHLAKGGVINDRTGINLTAHYLKEVIDANVALQLMMAETKITLFDLIVAFVSMVEATMPTPTVNVSGSSNYQWDALPLVGAVVVTDVNFLSRLHDLSKVLHSDESFTQISTAPAGSNHSVFEELKRPPTQRRKLITGTFAQIAKDIQLRYGKPDFKIDPNGKGWRPVSGCFTMVLAAISGAALAWVLL